MKEFVEVHEDENYMFKRSCFIREGVTIEIGVHPVMFGFRVRSGYAGDGYCYLDYCAGDRQEEVESIYSMCMTILTNNINSIDLEKESIYKDFPRQHVKPMYNDHLCFVELAKLCGPDIISVKTPHIHSKKSEQVTRMLEFLDAMPKTKD